MILGIAEDFTSEVVLDKGLTAVPSSGLFVNSGVSPSVTVGNLLAFLPKLNYSFDTWGIGVSYSAFTDSRRSKDVVSYQDSLWRCVKANTGQAPSEESEYWVETNMDSLRVLVFLESVKDKVVNDLKFTKQLVSNQYLYDQGESKRTPSGDYFGWCFEAKGSDYVAIRINSIALQKDGTTPVNVYVLNGLELIDTIQVTPRNGRLYFNDMDDLVLPLDGVTKLVIDSQEVYVGDGTVDPLTFDGFIAYTTTGYGEAPETADYNYSTFGNGLGFNVTAFLDSSKYLEYNLQNLGSFVRAAFEYMTFQMFLSNPNNRTNRDLLIQMDNKMLVTELKNNAWDVDTVASRYRKELKKAKSLISKSFDTQLSKTDDSGLSIETYSV